MTNKATIYKSVLKLTDYIKENKAALSVFLWVFAFGTVSVGGGYPFGFALYIASDKHYGTGFAALCFAILAVNAPIICIPVALGLYAYKKLSDTKEKSYIVKPLAAIIAMGFIWAAGVEGGIYTLAHSAPWLIIAPLFTILYSFALAPNARKAMQHGGYIAILFTLMLTLNGAVPFSVITNSIALFAAFIAASSGGMLYGGLYGFAAGLGCGVGSAAVCCVTGLCGGLFSVSGNLGTLLCGTAVGICTGFYFFGPQNAAALFFSYGIAAAAFWMLKDKFGFLPIGDIPIGTDTKSGGGTVFAEAFFAISQTARKNAAAESEAVRTADQYAGISTLLTNAEEKRMLEEHTDAALSSKAAGLLYGAGIRAKSVKVTGGRKKQLVAEGVELDRLSISSVQLKQLMSTALGCKMKEPQFNSVKGIAQMIMESAPRFRIECSRNGCPKKGEEISGDTVSFFSGEGGYFYALISDGMGSGKAAAESSRLAGMFLEKLLSAGADRKTALSLLNGFLASRKEEVFATVDLFEADLYTGKGVLVKAGAAPSFIIRSGACRKLQSATVPAGIIRDIKAEQLSFDLKDGDTLIMLSDGIAGDGDGAETEALLSNLKGERHTAAIADLLISDGARRTGNCDDMSVCVIKVIDTEKRKIA